MKDSIQLLEEKIEERLLKDRNGSKLKDVLHAHEYISLKGSDSSILEYWLGEKPIYTRIVWSKNHPQETPFAFSTYESKLYPNSPKTDFYTENYESHTKLMNLQELEEVIFGKR